MKLPNGFGSIHLISKKDKKKRRKPYRARVVLEYIEGKPKFHNVGYFATQMEAYEALVEYHKNPYDINKDITIKELYDLLCESSFKNLSTGRVRTFTTVFNNHLLPIHNMRAEDVKATHIKRILTNKSPHVQKEILTLTKRIIGLAIEDEYITKNVVATIKINSVERAEVNEQDTKPFNDEEIKRLWELFRMTQDVKQNITNKAIKNNVPIILLMLYTGIRVGELKTLRRMGNYFIGGIKTDDGKNRIIPIHPDVEEVLPYVDFNRNIGSIYNYIKKHFDHKNHDTRHTFVTYMRKNKADNNLLKAIVGHKDGDVTDGYDHSLDPSKLCEEMLKLNYPKC